MEVVPYDFLADEMLFSPLLTFLECSSVVHVDDCFVGGFVVGFHEG